MEEAIEMNKHGFRVKERRIDSKKSKDSYNQGAGRTRPESRLTCRDGLGMHARGMVPQWRPLSPLPAGSSVDDVTASMAADTWCLVELRLGKCHGSYAFQQSCQCKAGPQHERKSWHKEAGCIRASCGVMELPQTLGRPSLRNSHGSLVITRTIQRMAQYNDYSTDFDEA